MKVQLSELQKENEVREEEISAVENINMQLKQQLEEYKLAEQHYKNITDVSRILILLNKNI